MEYVEPVYRPPGEGRSFILQATVGCSHNGCTFCGMYKGKKFYIRSTEEIIADIQEVACMYRNFEKIFIADGDAIVIPTADLLRILEELKRWFPKARLISTYAGPKSTLTKSVEELKELHEAGLGRAYLGIESGDDAVLKHTNKGVTAHQMMQAGQRLKDAGIDLWGIILIGLGGRAGSAQHIQETIEFLNVLQPNHLSSMNYTPVVGTKLYQEVQNGSFEVLDAVESLQETRDLVAGLDYEGLHFTSDHASNYLPIKGTLRQDREKLLELLDGAISGSIRIRSEWARGL